MITDVQAERVLPTSIETLTMPTSLKLASDGGCQLTCSEKITVARQLHDSRDPAPIHVSYANLLVQMVGSVISTYPPCGDNIAFITSAEVLTPYLVAAQAKLYPLTSSRRIPLITLLKLTTFRMAAQDRWSLAYFGHVVIKNGIKIARSIKRDTSQFSESQTSMDRQHIWALPTTMEAFRICVRGFASAMHLLVHPSAVTPAELMDLFREIAEFYELYDCRVSVMSLAEVFKDHLTAYFTRLR